MKRGIAMITAVLVAGTSGYALGQGMTLGDAGFGDMRDRDAFSAAVQDSRGWQGPLDLRSIIQEQAPGWGQTPPYQDRDYDTPETPDQEEGAEDPSWR